MKKGNHLERASGYVGLSMYEDAVEEIEQAIALDENDPGLFFLKAECLRELGRFAEAVPPYRRALVLGGGVVENSVGLGWCLKRTGRLDGAIEVLKRAVETEGEVPILCYNLACYFSLKKRRAVSLRLLERAIELDERFRALAAGESDFDNIRDDPGFASLAEGRPH